MADPIEHPQRLTANLVLSGTTVQIGLGEDPDTVILNSDENVEWIFMSRNEAKLLIAALKTAIKQSKET